MQLSTQYCLVMTRPVLLDENCYIVFESSLLPLFSKCPSYNTNTSIRKTVVGTLFKIDQSCQNCSYTHTWKSQGYIKGIPLGNIKLSSAISFSGALPTVVLWIFENMKCAAIDPCTFFRHQSKPAISLVWFQHQSKLVQSLKDKLLIPGGDARADSPGHSVKYGSYSVFDLENKTMIDVQLVQVNSMTVFLSN